MRVGMLLLLVVWTSSGEARASTDVLVTEAVVNAPVDRVWDAFTTKAGMESWMAAVADIELVVGGRWRASYQKGADLNGDTAIHQTILSFDAGRMLSFRTIKSPANFPFAAAIGQTWTVVYFDPIDPKRTRVTVRMLGYPASDTAEAQKMRAFFESGNKATLDALVKRFSR